MSLNTTKCQMYLLDDTQHSIPRTAKQILGGVSALSQGDVVIILVCRWLVVTLLYCVQHLHIQYLTVAIGTIHKYHFNKFLYNHSNKLEANKFSMIFNPDS